LIFVIAYLYYRNKAKNQYWNNIHESFQYVPIIFKFSRLIDIMPLEEVTILKVIKALAFELNEYHQ